MPTPELPLKDNCNARICFDDINTCIIVLLNNLYLYVTHGNIKRGKVSVTYVCNGGRGQLVTNDVTMGMTS